jgi:predicted RNase H-like HicB family nuclease
MEKQNFTVIVERDAESGWLVGEVAELPGCYTQAPDLPQLERNIEEAIRGYLEVAQDRDPAPEFIGTFRIGIAV